MLIQRTNLVLINAFFYNYILGALHCVVCTDQGEVYTWGDNDEGQLGDGTTTGIHKPRLVTALQVI